MPPNVYLTKEVTHQGNSRDENFRDSLDLYLASISKISLLTPEQEKELAKRAQQGDQKAKGRLIEANLKLVVSIAKAFKRTMMPLEDIIQEGNIGLIQATKSFDYKRGYRFSTYASYWIKHYIRRALERQGRVIRVPSYLVALAQKLIRQGYILTDDTFTVDELARSTGIASSTISSLLLSQSEILSLNDEVRQGGVSEKIDWLKDREPLPEEMIMRRMEKDFVESVLDVLSPQEKEIISRHFGLSGRRETLREIGEDLHITRSRVQQLEKRALGRVRKQYTQQSQAREAFAEFF